MTHSHNTTRSINISSTCTLSHFTRKPPSSSMIPFKIASSKLHSKPLHSSFNYTPSIHSLYHHTPSLLHPIAASSSFASPDQPHQSNESIDKYADVPSFFDSPSPSPTLNTTTIDTTAPTTKINTSVQNTSDNSSDDDDILIEFKDVHKSFGSKHILRGASFKIRRGEAVGIIGSSGTGKSTTLRLAAGLLQPDKGEVLIKGEPRRGLLSDDDTSNKLKVGLVFQSGALFDSLTVRENVGFMLYEHTDLPTDIIERAVARSLRKVGLRGVENLYPSELSGGMKKRVALARAIVNEEDGYITNNNNNSNNGSNGSSSSGSDSNNGSSNGSITYNNNNNHSHSSSELSSAEQLIMYDEPTAGLDPVASTVIEDLIRSLHDPHGHGQISLPPSDGSDGHPSDTDDDMMIDTSNTTSHNHHHHNNHHHTTNSNTNSSKRRGRGITSYVVVTHQHSTIRRAVDRIIFLHEGKVVWEGSVHEFDTTDEPIVRQFSSGSLHGPIVYI